MTNTADRARAQVRDSLRARGLRSSVAKTAAAAMVPARQRSQPPKAVRQIVEDLESVIGEIKDRSTGGPAKRKTAAKKAALTRARAATRRSQAAKKAAATRRNVVH